MNPFDAMYEGTPPWETGRPQPAIVALIESGLVRGRVLDLGCGTGENALLLASRGFDVTAIDAAAKAIARADAKARQRGIGVTFRVHDALALKTLGGVFDTAIDCALFHTFGDDARAAYARSLAQVLKTGATLHLLCFSDEEPNWGGPRRVSRKELEATFGPPFAVESLAPARLEHLGQDGSARAWLARIVHVGKITSRGN